LWIREVEWVGDMVVLDGFVWCWCWATVAGTYCSCCGMLTLLFSLWLPANNGQKQRKIDA